ncbi:MAG: phage integrase SAM-like domain-containing protein [Terracidiphilus sp.]
MEREHRRALSLGQLHPKDPWPQPIANVPPTFRSFSKEFLKFAKTNTKAGTGTFYEVCLCRLLTFASIADARLDAINSEVVSRYSRYRLEVAKNSVVTVNGDIRTLRQILNVAMEWGRIDHAPVIHELPQPKGRERVLNFEEEPLYLGKASRNLRDAAIVAVDTGLRPNSELFPLKWADIDLTTCPESPNGVIHIHRGKSDSAQRSAPLTPCSRGIAAERERCRNEGEAIAICVSGGREFGAHHISSAPSQSGD